MKQYLINVAYAFDRFINAVFWGNPRELISTRMGRNIAEGRCYLCRPVCWFLDKLEKDHCALAAKKK